MSSAPEIEELRERLAQLTARVYVLEQRLDIAPAPAVAGQAPQPAAQPAPEAPPPAIRWPEPALEPEPFSLGESAREETLEQRVGQRWFSYLGVVAVVLGLGVLLRLAIVNDWLGLTERVIAGVLLGYALAGAGERLYRKGYPIAGYALSAVGTAAAYLALWAGHVLYHVVPPWLSLAGMAVVTAYNTRVALAKDSQRYAALALLGAFLAPALLGSHHNHEVALFLYLLILDAAVAVLSARRRWNWPLPAALGGTLVLAAGWALRWYEATQLDVTCGLIAAFLALFSFAARLARDVRDAEAEPARHGLLAVTLPLLTAASGWLALAGVLAAAPNSAVWTWRVPALLALWYFALHLSPIRDDRAAQRLWRWAQGGIAVALATAALTIKFSGRELIAAWLLEGLALALMAVRARDRALLRGFAAFLLVIAAGATVVANPYAGAAALWNPRFGTYALATRGGRAVGTVGQVGARRPRNSEGRPAPGKQRGAAPAGWGAP